MSIDRNGANIQQHAVLQFARNNLEFRQQGIGSDFDDKFEILRCMNVLVYFDREFRRRCFDWAATQMTEGALLLCGMDWADTRSARYSVSQLENGKLGVRELAISIDQLRPVDIVPWFSLSEDDYETLAMVEIIRILRGDRGFIEAFGRRLDALFAERGYCPRGANGYLGSIPADAPQDFVVTAPAGIYAQIAAEGFVDGAVASLNASGIHAWRNSVGHIAVDPETVRLPVSFVARASS